MDMNFKRLKHINLGVIQAGKNKASRDEFIAIAEDVLLEYQIDIKELE